MFPSPTPSAPAPYRGCASALAVFNHTAFASDAMSGCRRGIPLARASASTPRLIGRCRGRLGDPSNTGRCLPPACLPACDCGIPPAPLGSNAFLERQPVLQSATASRVNIIKRLGRTGDWARFMRQVGQDFDTDDSEIACLRAVGSAMVRREVQPVPRGIWEDRLTEACADAFAALVRAKQLSADDASRRFRTAADGGTRFCRQPCGGRAWRGHHAARRMRCNAPIAILRPACVVAPCFAWRARGAALHTPLPGWREVTRPRRVPAWAPVRSNHRRRAAPCRRASLPTPARAPTRHR